MTDSEKTLRQLIESSANELQRLADKLEVVIKRGDLPVMSVSDLSSISGFLEGSSEGMKTWANFYDLP